MTNLIFVYVTCPSKEIAQDLAKNVLQAKLAACANIFPSMESVYWWKGKIESAAEVVLIFKTKKHLYPDLEKKILSLHPYENPCVVCLPTEAASMPFLKWVESETN